MSVRGKKLWNIVSVPLISWDRAWDNCICIKCLCFCLLPKQMWKFLFKKNMFFSIPSTCDWTTVHSAVAEACGPYVNSLLEHSRKHTTTVWEGASEQTVLSHNCYLLTPTRAKTEVQAHESLTPCLWSAVCEGFPNSWWLPWLPNICAARIPWPSFLSFYLCQLKDESDQIAVQCALFPLPVFHRLHCYC